MNPYAYGLWFWTLTGLKHKAPNLNEEHTWSIHYHKKYVCTLGVLVSRGSHKYGWQAEVFKYMSSKNPIDRIFYGHTTKEVVEEAIKHIKKEMGLPE